MTGNPPSTPRPATSLLGRRPARSALGRRRRRCGPRSRPAPRHLARALRLAVGVRPLGPTGGGHPQSPGVRPDHGDDPVDLPGVDPGAPRPAAAVEPLQRARDAAGVQLASRHLQPARPGGLPVPAPPRLHRPGRGDAGGGRHRRLRPVPAPGCRRARVRHGRHGVRAQRGVLRLAGLADGVGDVVGGMVVRGGAAHRAGPAALAADRPSSR